MDKEEGKVMETLSDTQEYLNERNIFDIFHFLLGHVIVDRPTNPIEYLQQLLDDCISYRSGYKKSRLLWTKRHLDALCRSGDATTSEFLSLNYYKAAMNALGISSNNVYPIECVPGFVNRETFSVEALNNLEKEFARIMGATVPSTSRICARGTQDGKTNLEIEKKRN